MKYLINITNYYEKSPAIINNNNFLHLKLLKILEQNQHQIFMKKLVHQVVLIKLIEISKVKYFSYIYKKNNI